MYYLRNVCLIHMHIYYSAIPIGSNVSENVGLEENTYDSVQNTHNAREENAYELDRHYEDNTYDSVQGGSDSHNENAYEYAILPQPYLPAQTPGLMYSELGPPTRGETRQVALPKESVYSEVMKDEHNRPIHR